MINKRDIISKDLDNGGYSGCNKRRQPGKPFKVLIHRDPVEVRGNTYNKHREKHPEARSCSQSNADKCTDDIRKIGNIV